jgi:hypothetical protein
VQRPLRHRRHAELGHVADAGQGLPPGCRQ